MWKRVPFGRSASVFFQAVDAAGPFFWTANRPGCFETDPAAQTQKPERALWPFRRAQPDALDCHDLEERLAVRLEGGRLLRSKSELVKDAGQADECARLRSAATALARPRVGTASAYVHLETETLPA